MVEEVRRVYKENGMTHGQLMVGDGSRQVGFAASIAALQEKPAVGLHGIGESHLVGHLEIALLGRRQPVTLGKKGVKGTFF